MADQPPITDLLEATARGDGLAAESLLEVAHAELHRLARKMRGGEYGGGTVQTTMLVNDAWMNLMGPEAVLSAFENRRHFFGAAARAMRRLLVDHAREHRARKRGGDRLRVTLSGLPDGARDPDPSVLALHEALEDFAINAPDSAALVELRYFAGLTLEECAQVLERSLATVKREWSYARAWLHDRINHRRDEA